MNYIVMDLEWNQSNTGTEEEIAVLPFEIIEIGAVKLDHSGFALGEFSELIRPVVYPEMHKITSRLIHLQTQELEKGATFTAAAERFLEWCGEGEYTFCTWGSADLTEFQRNMKFYHLTPLAGGPIAFLDVQKLFSLAFEDGKTRKSLEHAIDFLELEKNIPFHRALSDASYTARIFTGILKKKPEVLENVSYDVFWPPADKASEIKVRFDSYMKYISREFDSKEEALGDREVASSKCYLCCRNLRKKIRWFTPNGRNYYCLARCEKHGYLKGKIRIRRADSGRLYIVKTTRLISDQEADKIRERSGHAKEMNKQSRIQKKSR